MQVKIDSPLPKVRTVETQIADNGNHQGAQGRNDKQRGCPSPRSTLRNSANALVAPDLKSQKNEEQYRNGSMYSQQSNSSFAVSVQQGEKGENQRKCHVDAKKHRQRAVPAAAGKHFYQSQTNRPPSPSQEGQVIKRVANIVVGSRQPAGDGCLAQQYAYGCYQQQ